MQDVLIMLIMVFVVIATFALTLTDLFLMLVILPFLLLLLLLLVLQYCSVVAAVAPNITHPQPSASLLTPSADRANTWEQSSPSAWNRSWQAAAVHQGAGMQTCMLQQTVGMQGCLV